MDQDKLVVVKLSPIEIQVDPDTGVCLARFRALGLTGYGVTPDDAVTSLKKLFHAFIHVHREHGSLVEQLERTGVEWHWHDEWPGDAGTYENTNDLFGPDAEAITTISSYTGQKFSTNHRVSVSTAA